MCSSVWCSRAVAVPLAPMLAPMPTAASQRTPRLAPLATTLAWSPRGVVTRADVRRALWGMTARPFMVGPVIRIRLTAPLPTLLP
jgi:hypothetical protein